MNNVLEITYNLINDGEKLPSKMIEATISNPLSRRKIENAVKFYYQLNGKNMGLVPGWSFKITKAVITGYTNDNYVTSKLLTPTT